MPRVNVPVTDVTRAGILPATEVNGDATNQHSFSNDGSTWLEVRNGGASPRTLTLVIGVAGPDGATVTNPTVALAASALKKVGPFPVGIYGTTMSVNVDHADIKLTAYRLSLG